MMTSSTISARAARRWRAIDPLLPAPPARPGGCGAEITVAGTGGEPAAVGVCQHWDGAVGSLDLCWGAKRQFRLRVQIAGPDAADALDRLLSRWRDHLARLPDAGEPDTAAVVNWPSRDVAGVRALLRHGFAPLTVAAARLRGRQPAGTAGGPPGRRPGGAAEGTRARIRRAGPADIDETVRLGLELLRFDAHFDCVIVRPGTADALRAYTARLLAAPVPWTWLAERDGTTVGMLSAEPPQDAVWIAPMVRAAPAAYLMQMIVSPGHRADGIGSALVAEAHREMDAAGVAVSMLHYGQLNPLSVPFWSRHGYRPLWTSWEARPARAIR